MLHGLRSYARTFEPLARHLSDRFHVVALDQRGRGDTGWDPDRNYYTDQYVGDLESFVAWYGRKTFHLLGHSMGGANALCYAHRNPDRLESIILEDSGPGTSQGTSGGVQRIVRELENTPRSFETWDAAEAFWRSIRPNVTAAAIASRVANSLRETADGIVWKHDQDGIAQCRISPTPGREVPDLWPAVAAVQCPGLILRGADSDYLSRETAKAVCARNPVFAMTTIPTNFTQRSMGS